MTWSIYDSQSGLITSRVSDQRQIIGRPHVNGAYMPGRWYVRDGQVIELPPQPVMGPQVQFEWDLATESWSVNLSRTAYRARSIRADMLAAVDRVNPMWWASMGSERQAEVAAYRQALLDITQQPGWPAEVAWPVKPPWL